MTLGVLMFFVVLAMTLVAGPRGAAPADVPHAEVVTPPEDRGWERHLDRMVFWVAVAVVLVLVAYLPFFLGYEVRAVSPGYRFF
jgi:cytochrome c oxidase subunit 1